MPSELNTFEELYSSWIENNPEKSHLLYSDVRREAIKWIKAINDFKTFDGYNEVGGLKNKWFKIGEYKL